MRRKPLPGKKIFGAVLTVAAVSAGLFGCRPPVEYITETTAEEKTSGANDEGEIMIVTKEEDPQEKMDEWLQTVLDGMTLEEKVGQMFMARCPEENPEEMASEYCFGGYILFARDFEGKNSQEAAEMIASYQEAAPYRMLFGLDEE